MLSLSSLWGQATSWWRTSTKPRTFFPLNRCDDAMRGFTAGDWLVLGILIVVFVTSGGLLISQAHNSLLVSVPARGGSISEGVIGSPRFINPLLATSDADRDLTQLVYAGLMKAKPDGSLVPELASDYTISQDGLTYTFTIRQSAQFHDGAPVTAEDVVFTIQNAKDPAIQSPKRASWEGVQVEKVDRHTVRFTLNQAYASFLENATLGILPKHVWESVPPEQFPFSTTNVEPVGAGPYQVNNVARSDNGVPEYYTLTAFENYALGAPYIKKISLHFYPNEGTLQQAYTNDVVEQAYGIPAQAVESIAKDDTAVLHSTLPRVFAVFFNQNQADIFAEQGVRRALNVAVDKEKIVNEVLSGYGTQLDGPIPPGFLPAQPPLSKGATTTPSAVDTADTLSSMEATSTATTSPRIAEAREILENAGWERGEDDVYVNDDTKLAFSLSTSATGELSQTAEMLAQQWRTLGADVSVEVFSENDLSKNVIRPRQYEALLFGEVVGRELDLFSFWHSSQRNDPGLNVAMYANITADELLDETRATTNPQQRTDAYRSFAEEVKKDVPAVFLYAPEFIYFTKDALSGVSLGAIENPAERFLDVHTWHLYTDTVWQPFVSSRAKQETDSK